MSQRETVLWLLQARGFKGVSARELNYQHGITRAAARIHELKAEGYDIEERGDEQMAHYVLRPAGPTPPPLDLCDCGHRRAAHLFRADRCLDMIDPAAPLGETEYCTCGKFHAA